MTRQPNEKRARWLTPIVLLALLVAADSQTQYVECGASSHFATKPCDSSSPHQARETKRCRCSDVSQESRRKKIMYRPECGPLDVANLENVEQIIACMKTTPWKTPKTTPPREGPES
jgi:hypothetical protein